MIFIEKYFGDWLLNKIVLGLIAIVLLVLTYAYASPYIAMYRIQTAIQNNDSELLSAYIDYPAVRESFKTQMNAKIQREFDGNNRWLNFGGEFASSVAEQVIDVAVTPESVMLVLQGKSLKDGVIDIIGIEDSEDEKTSDRPNDYTAQYVDINHFQIKLFEQTPKDMIVINMIRDGMNWKVNEIILNLK